MIRAIPVAVLVLLLSACGRNDALAPFAESRVPPSLAGRFFPPEGWAWGYVQAGDGPPQRYGVASPDRVPRAAVLIVPAYGETAEAWFETARNLLADGYTVWILDRAGQGGSGRFAPPRDRGHVTSFAPDRANLRALVSVVIRPRPDTPLVVLAQGDGLVAALPAMKGLGAAGLMITSPQLGDAEPPMIGRLAVRIGLGTLPAGPAQGWRRGGPDDLARGLTHDFWRGKVQQAWQLANPDLRMAGPSLAWVEAFTVASRDLRGKGEPWRGPVLMLQSEGASQALCRRLADCLEVNFPGAGEALHLEQDCWRKPWLKAVRGFVEDAVEAVRSAQEAPR
jgi:lysophospholipase